MPADYVPTIKGKAVFKDFADFAVWYGKEESCTENAAESFSSKINAWLHSPEITALPRPEYQWLDRIAGRQFSSSWGRDTLSQLTTLDDYVATNTFAYSVYYATNDCAIIGYGSKENLFYIPLSYLDIEEEKDYKSVDIIALRSQLIGDENPGLIPAKENLPAATLGGTEAILSSANEEYSALRTVIQDVEKGKCEELRDLQAELEKAQKALDEKKNLLLAELNRKQAEMQEKINSLKKSLFMLETEIYAIRCFIGETIELLQLRKGNAADIETPVVLNQKLRFLDEELGKLVSIYDVDGNRYHHIEELLQHRVDIVEYFCPQSKSVTFVRVSKENKPQYDEENILKEYENLHGLRIGILVRNGDNLYMGWTEEDHVFLQEEVFLRPGVKIIEEEKPEKQFFYSEKKDEGTSIKEIASRYFAFNILQGLLEQKKILALPETVHLSKPGPYVVYNYADAWLEDNRYGNLSDLNDKLSYFQAEGNIIMLVLSLSERDFRSFGGERGRKNSYRNRTHDCSLKSGLNKINLIEDGNAYVSAEKTDGQWIREYRNSTAPLARANFLLDKGEYIDLTYMNSAWIRYYIMSKKIGNFCSGNAANYPYIVRYLNMALDYLRARELEEVRVIRKYYPEIDTVNEWMVLLSHWKILNRVREITDHQAKRFGRYLAAGKYVYVKNLFADPYKDKFVNLSQFAYTKLEGMPYFLTRDSYCTDEAPYLEKYGLNTPYGKKYFSHESSDEEIKERAQSEIEKLEIARTLVKTMMDQYGWTISDIAKKTPRESSSPQDQSEQTLIAYIVESAISEDLSWDEERMWKIIKDHINNSWRGIWEKSKTHCFSGIPIVFIENESNCKEDIIMRFKTLICCNYLIVQVYPSIIRTINALEEDRYNRAASTVSEIPHR